MILHDANEVASVLGEVSPICSSLAMHQLLIENGEISKLSCALGSMMVVQESILIDHQEFSDCESVTSTNSTHTMDDDMVNRLFSEVTSGSIDLDEYLINLDCTNSEVRMDDNHLSTVWRVSPEAAREALKVTTHKSTHVDNPSLAK
eukprot:12393490-Ditylum_brightwellii.AAC.1